MTEENRSPDPQTILVGVSNPSTARALVRLSSMLAHEDSWRVLLTHVVRVAEQISLTTGQSSPEVVRARDFLQDVQGTARKEGMKARALVEVARSVDEGLLAAAESHDARMILLGYSEEGGVFDEREEQRFDRTVHRVARKARADVLVAKFRNAGFRRILVPISDGVPQPVVLLLCRALGRVPETSLTFLHVADPGRDPEEVTEAVRGTLRRAGLGGMGRIQIQPSDDPVAVALDESHKYDVVIVAPSGRPGFMDTFFSSKASEIAEKASVSVLVAWNRATPAEE